MRPRATQAYGTCAEELDGSETQEIHAFPTHRTEVGERVRLEAVALSHLLEPLEGLGVQFTVEPALEQWNELYAEELAAGHPLEIAPAAVMVGAVELGARKATLQPPEELLVVGVHSQRDLRLPAVSAKVPFTHENAHQEALLEGREVESCFTVSFHVKPGADRLGRKMPVELPDLSEDQFRKRLARAAGVSPSQGAFDRMFLHYRELRKWGRRQALVGGGMADQVIERLFAESLAAVPLLPEGARDLVDVGSGAGFPGLVLAAARPEMRVTLIEPRSRKWAFLRAAADRLALDVTCVNARVSNSLPSGLPERCDCVTVRALKLGDDELKALQGLLGTHGTVLSWSSGGEGCPQGFVEGRAVRLPPGRGRIVEWVPAK